MFSFEAVKSSKLNCDDGCTVLSIYLDCWVILLNECTICELYFNKVAIEQTSTYTNYEEIGNVSEIFLKFKISVLKNKILETMSPARHIQWNLVLKKI